MTRVFASASSVVFANTNVRVRETPKVDINIDAINGRLKKTILTKDRI